MTITTVKTFPAATEAGRVPSTAVLQENALAFNFADKIAFTREGNQIIQLGVSVADLAASDVTLDTSLRAWVNSTRPTRLTLGIDNVSNYGISDSFSLDSSSSYASSKAVNDSYVAMQAWVNTTRPTRETLDIDNVQNYGITNSYTDTSATIYASAKAVSSLNNFLTVLY